MKHGTPCCKTMSSEKEGVFGNQQSRKESESSHVQLVRPISEHQEMLSGGIRYLRISMETRKGNESELKCEGVQ
jgi:hypothetical protein